MANRRTFIETIIKGSVGLGLFGALSPIVNAKEQLKSLDDLQENESFDIPLTLGGVPLAGAWINTSIDDAIQTLETAWNLGLRSFDILHDMV